MWHLDLIDETGLHGNIQVPTITRLLDQYGKLCDSAENRRRLSLWESTDCGLRGRFAALLGEGRVLAESDESRYADPWPHTRLALGSSSLLLFKAIPGNHGSLAESTLAREIEVCCAYAGISVYRCDGDEGLRALLRDRRGRACGRLEGG